MECLFLIPGNSPAPSRILGRRERGTVSVECVARQPDTVNRPGLEPGPLEAESSALRIRLLRVGSGAAFFKTL